MSVIVMGMVSTGKVEASSAMINNAAVGVPHQASFSFSVYGKTTTAPLKRDVFHPASILFVHQWQHPITQSRGLLVTNVPLDPATRFLGCNPTYVDTYQNTDENWQAIMAMDVMEQAAAQ